MVGLINLSGFGTSDIALQEELLEEVEGLVGIEREDGRLTPTFPRKLEANELCLEIVTRFGLFARKGKGDDGVGGVKGELVGRPSSFFALRNH